MIKRQTIKGSLTVEYAILIGVVIMAFVAMAPYVTRSLCGRWRQSADVFGYGRLAPDAP